MLEMDRDLQSIQEVRNLIAKAKEAQKKFGEFSQEKIDQVIGAIAEACEKNAQVLAKMAVEETGFGVWQDKVIKNLLGSKITYEFIKDMKTVGVIKEDPVKKVVEIGVPMGIVAALIPSTNPTSTTMYKTLIALKAGNAIIFSPHPSAKKSICETVRIIQEAAAAAGAPEGLIGVITLTTPEATAALMKDKNTGIILATGGEAMVRAAYSSGNPALGVGPGNGPAFIERSADIPMAVRRIFDSKTFDNGTICASEQSIVIERVIEQEVIREVEANGGYFMTEEQSKKVAEIVHRANGTMNPKVVGKTAQFVAEMAGIEIPAGTRVLLSRQYTVSPKNPYSREKLCPVLGFYVEDDWKKACDRCIELLQNEGVGHTMIIHSNDQEIIREFALKKPVSRLLINTPGALGGVGGTTGLAPALTLGCGAVGGSATSDNITPWHLINIRRAAVGITELSDIKKAHGIIDHVYEWVIPYFGELADFCRAREPFCFKAVPVPQAAVLYSQEGIYSTKTEEESDKQRVFAHFHPAVWDSNALLALLLDNQYSADVVLWDKKEADVLKNYGLIAVPNFPAIEEETKQELLTYAKNGGSLLLTGPKTAALFAEELGLEISDVTARRSIYLAHNGRGVGVKAAFCRVNGTYRELGKFYLNNFLTGEAFPSACEIAYGKGKVGVIPFAVWDYNGVPTAVFRRFFGYVANELWSDAAVKVKGSCSAFVEVGLMKKDDKLCVNLMNTLGGYRYQDEFKTMTYDEVPPLYQIEVEIACEKAPKSVYLEPEHKELAYTYEDGKLRLTLEKLEIHSILVIE